MELLLNTSLLLTALLLLVATGIWKACLVLLWRPYAVSRSFRKQGISGPPYKFLSGSLDEIKRMKKEAKKHVLDLNSHDITERVVPHYNKWFSQYGETFLYWNGVEPRISISDPELVKQILSNKFGFYTKPTVRPELLKLAGKGLVFVEGLDWVRHKRILNPAFSIDKLKVMTKRMADRTMSMFEEWSSQRVDVADEAVNVKMDMHKEFTKLTADIIASTSFGSSYADGIEAFKAQRELQKCCAASFSDLYIPGSQYLPTPLNVEIWRLDGKINNSLKKIIETRLNSKPENSNTDYGDDLLGLMLTASKADESKENGVKMKMEEIVEECKTFSFAGHETTSNLLTWTLMALSLHKDWQHKLREEVLEECGSEKIPNADSLAKLKLMNMVLMEVLRLYCPAILLVRKALENMKLGHVSIPKGTAISIPIPIIHRRKDLWGEDADEFNPFRFVNGVSKAANHPSTFIAFSLGPRACIGQNFAMLEAKMVLTLILQRFQFYLDPEYKHAPIDYLTLQPQYGLPVTLKSVKCTDVTGPEGKTARLQS